MEAMEAFPRLRGRPAYVVPHPHYRADYPASPARSEARARLGLPADARVVGFVGHVRGYKNVPALVRAFRQIDDPRARLLVAGRPESQVAGQQLRELSFGDDRIHLALEMVPDVQIPVILAATDLVALPYGELLNSGAALLALSFDRPVLVPDRGAMSDLRRMVGSDWVRLYDEPLTTRTLGDQLADVASRPPAPPAPLDAFDPQRVAEATLDVYRAVLGVEAGGR
jgi:glycosyltransferase involved in cell wall biosynthesis